MYYLIPLIILIHCHYKIQGLGGYQQNLAKIQFTKRLHLQEIHEAAQIKTSHTLYVQQCACNGQQ